VGVHESLLHIPERASTGAGQIDALYAFSRRGLRHHDRTDFFFVFYFAVKYRRRTPEEGPAHSWFAPARNRWSVIPLFIMFDHVCMGDQLYFENYTPRARYARYLTSQASSGCGRSNIGGSAEINELQVPLAVPQKLTLASEDVIHASSSRLRLKHDVVPAITRTYWFQATKPGRITSPSMRRSPHCL